MDLQLAFRVLWRFRILVAVGFVLACALAILSMVRVDPGGSPFLSYRTQPQYESDTTVFVTTPGFWPGNPKFDSGKSGPVDPDVLRSLAALYVQLAANNDVMTELKRTGPVNGTISANQLTAQDSSTLPLIQFAATAATPAAAYSLGSRHLHAMQSWLRTNQNEAQTHGVRIVLKPEVGPLPAQLIAGRKKTKAILIFVATLLAFCGLAFVLENLHPRIRAVSDGPEEKPADAETRTLADYTPASTRQPIGRKRSRRARRRA
jgi:hypothetical protein